MPLLRVSFGHGVRIGSSTYTHLDLAKQEFQAWKSEVNTERQYVTVTDHHKKTVIIPFANIAYLEVSTNNESRPEENTAPNRTSEAGKGKARAT